MSSATASAGYGAITSINFTGGLPTSNQLAPSIIFIILYAITIPVLLFRLFRTQDRTVVLIRPCIFVAARLAMLVIRAYMCKNTYSEGLLIAELVLVSIGFLFLIEPIVAIWQRHVDSAMPRNQRPRWVMRLALVLRLTLIAAIGTAIAGAAQTSNAFSNPSDTASVNTVRQLREASYILSLAVVAVAVFATILTHFSFGLDARRTAYLLVPSGCLIIVAVYRVVQTYTSNPSAPARSIAAFWILQILFEFLAYVALLAISIPTWFPGDMTPKSDVEMGNVQQEKRGGLVGRFM